MCLFANRCSWNAHIMVPPKSYLCSPFLSSLPCRWRFAVALLCGFMEDLKTAVIAEVFNTLSFCLKCSVKWTTLKTKRNHPFAFSLWLIDPVGVRTVMSGFSVFPYSGKKRYFSCSPLSIALCNGASIHEYKAYWQGVLHWQNLSTTFRNLLTKFLISAKFLLNFQISTKFLHFWVHLSKLLHWVILVVPWFIH